MCNDVCCDNVVASVNCANGCYRCCTVWWMIYLLWCCGCNWCLLYIYCWCKICILLWLRNSITVYGYWLLWWLMIMTFGWFMWVISMLWLIHAFIIIMWLILDDGGSVVANSHCVELVSGCCRILDDGGSVSWVIPDFGTTCI
jgi:hypothetical protein